MPELLGEDEALVGRANALFQGATRITMLLGPVLGGILIATVSAPWALVVDAATYVVSAVLLLTLVPRPAPLPPTDEDVGARRGLRFLAREPLLRLWIPLFALGDTAWTAFFVSVPVLVVTRFDADPRVAGWLLASFGVGAVAGNVVAYKFLLERVGGLTLVGTCILGQALPLWLLTIHPPAWLAAVALGLSGLANGLVNPTIHSLMTLRVPPQLRPSVMTVNVMIFGLAQPLGVFGVGPVLDAFGPQPVLVAFAAMQTLAMTARRRRRASSCAAERAPPRRPRRWAHERPSRTGHRRAARLAGHLVARLADDVPRAAVVRPRDDRLADADEHRARSRAGAHRDPRHPVGRGHRALGRASHDARLGSRAGAADRIDPLLHDARAG